MKRIMKRNTIPGSSSWSLYPSWSNRDSWYVFSKSWKEDVLNSINFSTNNAWSFSWSINI